MNETPQKTLTDLLDQIEQREQTAQASKGKDMADWMEELLTSIADVPALVKALRLALAQLEYIDPDRSGSTWVTKAEIAQLLSEPAEEKK